LHWHASCELLPIDAFEFAWHDVHAVAPPSENVATSHAVHSIVSRDVPYVPASHGMQEAPDKR
jgi:hypothetical protein